MRPARRRTTRPRTTRLGIRELKARFSEVIRRVREEGGEVEVTDRGRPVARIVSIERKKRRRDDYEEGIDALIHAGYLKKRPARGPFKLPPLIKPKRPVDFTRMIREDRDAGP